MPTDTYLAALMTLAQTPLPGVGVVLIVIRLICLVERVAIAWLNRPVRAVGQPQVIQPRTTRRSSTRSRSVSASMKLPPAFNRQADKTR